MEANKYVTDFDNSLRAATTNTVVAAHVSNATANMCGKDAAIRQSSYMSLISPPLPQPYSPLIACNLVPEDFLSCEQPLDLSGNATLKEQLGYGCLKYGGQKYHEVEHTSTKCTVAPLIECYGNRTYVKDGVPCIKYSGHYFLTTLLYSLLLGFAGIDRFCLGHVGTAVGKLLTLGGFGVWYIIDILLLISGDLLPEDGSNWVPFV